MEVLADKIITKLRGQGFLVKVLEHESVITIDDVVRVLQIPTDQMAKTILFFNKQIGLIAVVLTGMSRVDYTKIAKIFQVSRKSITLADQGVLYNLGLSPGDVCPFYEFFSKVLVDVALLDQQAVFCGSGDPTKTILINTEDMVKATHAMIADISQKSVNS
jgi:prolyl-tRNA editing enzyme YbaK/EbsC (Cys-tRNA(Pro) deacylase)